MNRFLTLILSLSLVACSQSNGTSNSQTASIVRLPKTPAARWIWPDDAHASQWIAEHPRSRICKHSVPDGVMTGRCPRKPRKKAVKPLLVGYGCEGIGDPNGVLYANQEDHFPRCKRIEGVN